MMAKNLLNETIECLEKHGHTTDDVYFVSDGRCWCSWQKFAEKAEDFYYNAGFGLEEVNTFLKVVGKDWWLERHTYDGSEWWEYKKLPQRPEEKGYIILMEK